MKCEITKEIFIALREAIPLEHFAFSSPMPEHGFSDRQEHFKSSNDTIFADVIYNENQVSYLLFANKPERPNE